MKIYFTCSTAQFLKYKKLYFGIRDFLVEQKHILTRDWLKHTQERIDAEIVEITDIKAIYKGCIQAINDADLVIIEDTVSNFSTGHQITLALQRQKPTLVLWSAPKHRHFKNTFIQGVESEYLEVAEYTQDNYQEIIHRFIKKFEDVRKRNRFHLVLNDVERKYLDWGQYAKSKSRTKIIREAIRKYLSEDSDYQEYLTQA